MKKISKISVQKQQKDRYNIFFNNGHRDEYAFSVDEAVLIKYQLKKGMEIDSLMLSEIQFQDEIHKAYNSAISYLARRMRTETEVRKYLQEKEYSDFIIHETIIKLYKKSFLNDQDYAFAYVRTQINTANKGPELIKRELQEKGVPNSLIEHAIKEYSLEKQVEIAIKLVNKFKQKNNNDSFRILKQKIEQMLIRKGFPFSIIEIAVEEYIEHDELNNEMNALQYQAEKAHRKYRNYTGFEYEKKMKQYLFRKGFSLELIEQFLEKQDVENY